MRILLISDIHANLTALEAVLADAKGKWDQLWCLGDIIGYGPDPNECVALLREQEPISLVGNHDWAALDKIDISIFNPVAARAIMWTREQITPETTAYLNSLNSKQIIDDYTIVHASPREPIWEYVVGVEVALANFEAFDTPYCLLGHSHVALRFTLTEDSIGAYLPDYIDPIELAGSRHIINPGSVGQPRDSDPRASYAILDTEKHTLQHIRVPYDIAATQARMTAHQLPSKLITRLAHGW